MPRELIIRVSAEEETPNGYYLQVPPSAYLNLINETPPPDKTEIIGNTVILIYEEPMFGEWITINIKGNYTEGNYLCWEAPKYLIPALGEDEVNTILINYCPPNQLNQ